MKGKDVHQIVVKRKDIFGIIVGIHLLIWILNLPFSQLQMLLLGRRAITLYQLGMLECLLLGLLFMRSYHQIRFHLYIGFCFSINIFRSVFKIDKQGDFYKRCDVLFYILECFLCDPYSCGPDGIQD